MGDYWQLTIDVLQSASNPIVDKPKLQEKYLTKPPFRYLHDVVTAVQTNTGFAPGLYTGEELDAKGIQDKDAKVTYLQKIVDVVGIVLNQHVPAKPLKIVAGLEPENTNLFLQMLGAACRVGDGADAVQRVLAGEHQPNPGGGASGAPDRPSSRPSSQQRPGAEEDVPATSTPTPPEVPTRASPSRSKRASDAKGSEDPPPAAAATKTSSRSKDKEPKAKAAAPPPPPPEEPPAAPPAAREVQRSLSKSRKPDDGPPPLAPQLSSEPNPDDPMRRTLMRPQSARKAPPKAGGGAATPTTPSGPSNDSRRGDRPMGNMPTTPSGARPVKVMEEGAGGASDDDVEVVHEAVPVAIGANRDAGGERGVLVKNILDAEQNLKKAGEEAAAGAGGGDGGGGGTGIILGKRIAKAGAAAGGGGGGGAGGAVRTTDTTAIKEMVQKLCQSTHPLAKSMDYLSEDLENMSKEYRFWQVEKRMFADKLAGEQRLLGDSVAAETQLADLDGQIRQVRDRILGIKSQLLRSDETINKLLSMAVGR